jgi:hyaluronoglucosaminidase
MLHAMVTFAHRGVVEGFYGAPYTHGDRVRLIERLGAWGMNRYLYAPKDEPLHRERWRDLYPSDALAQHAELAACGEAHRVTVGFALSPGLSIVHCDTADRRALLAKLGQLAEAGAGFVVLALDDVPAVLSAPEDRAAYASLAEAHIDLVLAARAALGSAVPVWLVPTDYLGVEPTPYLAELGASLPADVEIFWTGRTVLSPTVTAAEADRRAACLRRRPLLWDNLPVADGPMRNMLHLGPYAGREAALAHAVSGVFLNPMDHPRASEVMLRAASVFLADPRAQPEAAWEAAVQECGAGAPDAFRLFATAHRFGPQCPHDRDAGLEAALDTLFAQLAKTSAGDPAQVARAEALIEQTQAMLRARADVAGAVREGLADRALTAELLPWLLAHHTETRRMEIALDALAAMRTARVAADVIRAWMRMEGRLTRLDTPRHTSYGPRRVLYPQLRSMREEDMDFGDDPCLITGQCLADEVVTRVARRAAERLAELVPNRPRP